MSDPRIVWAVFAPLIGGTLAALFLQPLPARWRPRRAGDWPAVAALLSACGGLLAAGVLALLALGGFELQGLGLTLQVSPLARVGLLPALVACLCVLFIEWVPGEDAVTGGKLPAVISTALTASLVAGALLAADRLVQALLLLGVALPVAALATLPLTSFQREGDDVEAGGAVAGRVSGAVKLVAGACVGTGLLLAGGVWLARYPFNMERVSALQLGLGLLAVGLAVRVGAMPFAGSAADLAEAAPKAAILLLGAVAPTVLVTGAVMLAPVFANPADVSRAGRQLGAGMALGALGAILAGVRALAARRESERRGGDAQQATAKALLVSSSVALQTGWALFGVLSGTHAGTVGAALLAANMALAVPLLLAGGSRLATVVGAGSLLGLPPFGGFVGTLLVAGAAVESGGWWLAALLLGSWLAAASWASNVDWLRAGSGNSPAAQPTVIRLLTWALVAAQFFWLVLSIPIVQAL